MFGESPPLVRNNNLLFDKIVKVVYSEHEHHISENAEAGARGRFHHQLYMKKGTPILAIVPSFPAPITLAKQFLSIIESTIILGATRAHKWGVFTSSYEGMTRLSNILHKHCETSEWLILEQLFTLLQISLIPYLNKRVWI